MHQLHHLPYHERRDTGYIVLSVLVAIMFVSLYRREPTTGPAAEILEACGRRLPAADHRSEVGAVSGIELGSNHDSDEEDACNSLVPVGRTAGAYFCADIFLTPDGHYLLPSACNVDLRQLEKLLEQRLDLVLLSSRQGRQQPALLPNSDLRVQNSKNWDSAAAQKFAKKLNYPVQGIQAPGLEHEVQLPVNRTTQEHFGHERDLLGAQLLANIKASKRRMDQQLEQVGSCRSVPAASTLTRCRLLPCYLSA
jgi:hypothetical protein